MYATRGDWLFLLGELESSLEVKYGLDWQDGPGAEDKIWTKAVELPDLGIARGRQTLKCSHFKIFSDSQGGRNRFDADLWPGGDFDSKTLIAGTVTTLYDDPALQRIMRKLASLLKKHFKRVGAYWVGPDALEKLRSGARLTLNVDASTNFNLSE